MAIQDSYTLDDITSVARKEFSTQFAIIDSPSKYKFENRSLFTEDLEAQEVTVLHIAYWYSQQNGIRVWAQSDNNVVRYFCEKPGQSLVATPSPFRDGERNWVNAFQGPFAHIPFHRRLQASQKEGKIQLKAMTRQRLGLLIQLAFLIAGHIDNIPNAEKRDLLAEVKELCIYMYNNKIAKEEAAWKADKLRAENMGEQQEEDSAVSLETDRSESASRDASRRSSSIAVRGFKRMAYPHDDLFNEIDGQYATKRIRIDDLSMLSPDAPEQPSMQLHSIFESLVKQCKAETKAQLAQEKAGLEQENRLLQSRSADAEKRAQEAEAQAEEWKEKYEKLKEKLARLMGDD